MKLSFLASGNGKFRDKLTDCDVYIALVTPCFVQDDKCLGEMYDANALKKKMFALVDSKVFLPDRFFTLNWKLILYFTTPKEFEFACKFLRGFLENMKID